MTPNIVYILADDMGYGDISGLNKNSAFQTPHLDKLIEKGMTFSDAHTSSSVCTPSRYSILTGRYCWRTYLKEGVLCGTGNGLIEQGRETIASLAKNAGYDTACIGKWHIGWEWPIKPTHKGEVNRDLWSGNDLDWIDYHAPIKNGPTTHGFDYFYGISGSLDMPPYVYIENERPVEEPTAWASGSEFFREGPRMQSMRANNVLAHLTDKSVEYIHTHNSDRPFLLYFPLTAPHTPIAPAPEFAGVSGVNPYADFCIEVDHRVGQIYRALEESGQLENTLVIFTTDNGASSAPSECSMLEKHYGHFCSHIYRGYKSDIWEGGHRIPFLTHWPETIPAKSVCEQRVGIFDFFATFAEITEQSFAEEAGEDSVSFLPALYGKVIDEDQRWALIHHSIDGAFAIRKGPWKLCRCPGSGGWTSPTDQEARDEALPQCQLYNLDLDPSETNNLIQAEPDMAKEMTQILHRCVVSGRSTPGATGKDDSSLPLEDWTQVNWLPEIPEQYVLDD